MDALTPARRLFGPCDHEHRSGPGGSPCFLRSHFQPFCPQPPRRLSPSICSSSRFLSARDRRPVDQVSIRKPKDLLLRGSWRGLRSAVAGSPVGAAESGSLCVMSVMSRRYGRVVHFRQLPTSCRHEAVAFGCRRVNFPPDGDFHPAVCSPSQAHDREPSPARSSHAREMAHRSVARRLCIRTRCEPGTARGPVSSRAMAPWSQCQKVVAAGSGSFRLILSIR